MATIKINQKSYPIPQLSFSHMTEIEDMGFSVMEITSKNQVFSIATAFVGIVAECSRKEAEELCQQHIMGGGNLFDICEAFTTAVSESAFFKKLLGKETRPEPEKKTKKTSQEIEE